MLKAEAGAARISDLWPRRSILGRNQADRGGGPSRQRSRGLVEMTGCLSTGAQRMRLHRQRRRAGLRCLMVELRETEIEALIRTGLLMAETRNDSRAIRKALYAYLDRTLGKT